MYPSPYESESPMSTQELSTTASQGSACAAQPTLEAGTRVHCHSLSQAGGLGTVQRRDDRLVWVRLDSGATRAFLRSALTVVR